MQIRWHGQSAYTLTGASQTVAIDPFGNLGALLGGRRRFDYAPAPTHAADLLLVTHEHADHNAVEVITGTPRVVRSTAGRFETPLSRPGRCVPGDVRAGHYHRIGPRSRGNRRRHPAYGGAVNI